MFINRLVPHLRGLVICRARNVLCEQTVINNCAILNSASKWQRTYASHINQSNDQTIELITKSNGKISNDPKATAKNSIESNSSKTDNIGDDPLPELKTQCTAQYLSVIQDHLKNHKLKEAFVVVEKQMIQQDRVKPDEFLFKLLMDECGRLGYAKKSFQLYKLMKKCGYKPTEETFTNMLNACLVTPYPTDGLVYVRRTENEMRKRQYEATALQENLLVQVSGQCGDLDWAISQIDTLKRKNIAIDINTFKLLLHIASMNSENGFRYAFVLWHKMYEHDVTPDIYTFHLLLKCVCDCGIGNIDTVKNIIDELMKSSSKRNSIHSSNEDLTEHTENLNLPSNDSLDNTPNLLSRAPRLGTLLPLNDVEEPEHRLLLLGGVNSFLNELHACGEKPTLGTFMQLLSAIPPTIVAETKLLRLMKAADITPDLTFLNMLLKKRCSTQGYIESKDVLNMFFNEELEPNTETFGLLSYSCTTMDEIYDFLDVLKEHSYKPNIIVFESFLRNACKQNSFEFIEEILDMVKQRRLEPSSQFIELIDEFFVKYPKKFLIRKSPSKFAVIRFAQFSRFCRRWKREINEFDGIQESSAPGTQSTRTEHTNRNVRNIRRQPIDNTTHDGDSVLKHADSIAQSAPTSTRQNRKIPSRPNNKFAAYQNVAKHPWDTFESNKPEGRDVNNHHRPTTDKRRKNRPRRRNNAEQTENKLELVDSNAGPSTKSTNPFKREPRPPKLIRKFKSSPF